MKVIVITTEDDFKDEINTCNAILNSELFRLHIRKPNWDNDRLKKYIDQIDYKYYSKISLHRNLDLVNTYGLSGIHWSSTCSISTSNHTLIQSKSYHSLEKLETESNSLNYAFLSPIFNSISKKGYNSTMNINELGVNSNNIKNANVFALGGIKPSHKEILKKTGFMGMALLGSFWNEDDINSKLKIIKDLTHE